jgi:cellulose synthase/poly-beta-1,6-N-acetylglucosamine synthase-like glycosyltransferase
VVVFDADTRVDAGFLRVMDARLAEGASVVQGQHRIANPDDGWFPALTWAMFLVDNRFQNLGRSNLGLSAKNMGDSICLRADVVRRLGWGEGLTEDYAFRQRLLLDGTRIVFEPAAVGYGEAPLTWGVARRQRARWLRGTHDASRRYARRLLRDAMRQRSPALLDGALQAYLPSFSTLAVITGSVWLGHAAAAPWGSVTTSQLRLGFWIWSAWLLALIMYPVLALALERAPLKAYVAVASGPLFVAWRSWLAATSRLQRQVTWVRTPRKVERRSTALPAR